MIPTTAIGKLLLRTFYVSITVAVLVIVILVVSRENSQESRVYLSGQGIRVILADTPALQEKGLSGYTSLKESEGMLFVFEKPNRVSFWMKDMLFPIDIIWFGADRRIIDVWENASPNSYPEVRVPGRDAQYVLEVRARFFKDHQLKIGDVLELESSAGYTR